ncbi:hypothetical protein UFOVP1229_142 [uncultured Caudovirales phage]|uniref:Uncharacterized protein n=1 Tax=uncultured Caudovirales phage TaxID=2100421 RepID=A0A6J5R7L7_9CAUD|nr:hypothetical protein UFOVP1229_142 [uncultured Caudovirales phage]
MTNDFPGTKLPDLSKLPATDREKQIAEDYSRISIEDTVPVLVVGHQSFQLGGLTGLGDGQANWTCWMLAKAIQKIEDAVYDKVEAAIAKDLEDVDPNIVLMEAEARDRDGIIVTDSWGEAGGSFSSPTSAFISSAIFRRCPKMSVVTVIYVSAARFDWLVRGGYIDTDGIPVIRGRLTFGSVVERFAKIPAYDEDSRRELLAANAGLTVDVHPLEGK